MTKPISQQHLVEAIRLALENKSQIATPAWPTTRHTLPASVAGLRILLAEDNQVNQRVACRILEREDCSMTVAGNGREVLKALEVQTFDLILMDIQMPELDGLQTTAIIRKNERGTGLHIPIIALTAHAMSGDRERLLDAGMDGYVTKPIRLPELLTEVARVRSANMKYVVPICL